MFLPSTFNEFIQLVGVGGAIASFLWGVWVWKDKSKKELAQQRVEAQRFADNRRIEATKPFLERQLRLYTEASEVAACIAAGPNVIIDHTEIQTAKKRFWQLYYGELALVENVEVEEAMVQLGEAISGGIDQSELRKASLNLAVACRRSLATSWGIQAWENPDGDFLNNSQLLTERAMR